MIIRSLITASLTATALSGLALQPVAAAAPAPLVQGFSVKGALAGASDSALDKLSAPGAFYDDKAVRVLLPGPLRKASSLLRFTSNAGLTKDITKNINKAAGLAAQEAKPIFRAAIDNLSLSDGVGIATGGKTAATDYLRSTSGVELRGKMRPLITAALTEVGVYDQMSKLQSLGPVARLAGGDLSNDGITDSVTEQAMDGIFAYIGKEEANFRKNPLEKGKGALGKIFGG